MDTAASRKRFPVSGEQVLLAGLCIYVLVLTILPLGRLLVEGLQPGDEGEALGVLLDTWTGRAVGRALPNTIVAGLASTLVSVVIGAVLAFVLRLTDLWGKSALIFLAMLPMLIPPQISALAWIELSGPSSPILRALALAPPPGTTNPLYSLGGIIFVMGIEHSPLVFLAVAAALGSVSNDLVEAARVSGIRPGRIVGAIIVPAVAPALTAGAALAFVSAIGNFGVPALLGIPGRVTLLTTLIYQRLNGFGPSVLGQVAAIAFILIGLAIVGLAVRAFLVRQVPTLDRTGEPIRPFALGRWRLPATLVVWLVMLVLSILPLIALVAGALVPAIGVRLSLETLSLENFQFVLFGSDAIRRAFANSMALAGLSALICAAAAVPLSYFAIVRNHPLAKALDMAAEAPYAVPGTVVALGIIIVFLPPIPLLGFSIYGSFLILLVAYLARFLLLALRPVSAAFATMDPALDEAARVSGIRSLRRLAFIAAPIALPSAIAGAMLIFMAAFNELTLSALLWSTGVETLGVVVFFLQYEGNSPAAAALASVVVAVTLLLAAIVDLAGRRLAPGAVPWDVR
ncbi:MAG: ABC transporter permease [Rhizobiales bacterium]|nr:ABC transporter permease [Hyphomicrobiales bacterium]